MEFKPGDIVFHKAWKFDLIVIEKHPHSNSYLCRKNNSEPPTWYYAPHLICKKTMQYKQDFSKLLDD